MSWESIGRCIRSTLNVADSIHGRLSKPYVIKNKRYECFSISCEINRSDGSTELLGPSIKSFDSV